MVLDQQTQDIVSLKEFEERTRLRCLSATEPDNTRDQTQGEAPQFGSDTSSIGSVERNVRSDSSCLANQRQHMGDDEDSTQGKEAAKPNGLKMFGDDFEPATPISSVPTYIVAKDPAQKGEIQGKANPNIAEALGDNPAELSNPKKGNAGG